MTLLSALRPLTNLRLVRLQRGARAVELAAATGLTTSRLSLLEIGRREPRADELERLAHALRVPPSKLRGKATPD